MTLGLCLKRQQRCYPNTNFPEVNLGEQIKISFYEKDHANLKQRAELCGLKIQQLLEFVLLATYFQSNVTK